MFQVPAGAQLWPDSQQEPTLDGGLGPLELKDGIYFLNWPGGTLRLLARVWRGRVEEWVTASEAQDSGCCCSETYPRSAQRYYNNGTQEDFSPWDDNSPPYPAEQPFAEWLAAQAGSVCGQPAPPAAVVIAPGADRSELPIPGSERAFSCEEIPSDLEDLVARIKDVRWTSALQCYERLVNWAQCDLGLARDFTNLAPHACASVLFGDGGEAVYELPVWLEPGTVQRGKLDQVPLYLRLRELAQSKAEWVRSLAQFLPRRAHSLIWTTPSEPIDPFWMAMHCVSLRLRQEASSQKELGSCLQNLDSERFFRLGGLVGALLQAPAFTGCWFFNPILPPGPKCNPFLDDLAGLLSGWSEFQGPANPSQNHWIKAPLLAGLGEWVNLQCSDGPPDPVLWQLARFVQNDRNNLCGRLSAFSRGLMHWDDWCNSWPGVYNSEPGSMQSHWGGLGIRVKERADEFISNPATEQLLENPEATRFGFRVQIVAHRLTNSLQATNRQMQSRATELEEHLGQHSTLSPEECLAFEQAILGRPLKPGPVFAHALQACRWTFLPWVKPGINPASTIFPALRIFFDLLAEF